VVVDANEVEKLNFSGTGDASRSSVRSLWGGKKGGGWGTAGWGRLGLGWKGFAALVGDKGQEKKPTTIPVQVCPRGAH